MIFVSSFCTSDTQSSHLRGSVEQARLDTFAAYLHREQKFSTRIPIFRSAKQWRYQSSRSSAIELEGRSKKEERKGKERKEVEESGVASWSARNNLRSGERKRKRKRRGKKKKLLERSKENTVSLLDDASRRNPLSKYTNPSAALSDEIYAHKISIRETLTSPAKKKNGEKKNHGHGYKQNVVVGKWKTDGGIK